MPVLVGRSIQVSARESLAVNGTEAPSHNGPANIKDSSALSNSVLSASKESSGDPQNAGKAAAMDVRRHPDDSALALRSKGLIESRLSDLERRLDAHTRHIDDHFDCLDGHLLRMHMQMTMMQHSFMKNTQAMLQQVFDEVVTLRAEIAELRDDI
ncbi:hypothetical protein MRX96_044317 [Rhipicephalus microplus]